MATLVYRPDAHPETSSVDGWIRTFILAGTTWATLRAGITDSFSWSSEQTNAHIQIKSDSSNDKWEDIYRGILSFDTSDLADDLTITSATVSLRGLDKADGLGITPNINIYGVTLADDTRIADNQGEAETVWDSFGSAAYSTAVTYNGWDVSGWNNFALNSTGLAAISRDSNTRFGIRNANYDVSGSTPSWSSSKTSDIFWYTADYGDGSFAPKLTITYTSSTLTAGNFAVVETRLQYIGTDSVERYILGIIIGDGVNAAGNVAVVEERIQYIGATSNKERYWLGTLIGDAVNPAGSIAVVESRIQYVDTSSKERYIKGVPV